ncbi:MAG: PP2C family protein-serine/threonine phosphatase [Candidatus Rifleibacteriota bacterium]
MVGSKPFIYVKRLVLLLLVIIPFLVVYETVNGLFSRYRDEAIGKKQTELRNELIDLAEKTSPEGFYFRLFSGLANALRKNNEFLNPKTSSRLIKAWMSRAKCDFNVYVFDGKGEIVKFPDLSQANRFVISGLWKSLAQGWNQGYLPPDEKINKRIQTLLGSETNVGKVKNGEGRLIPLKRMRVPGFIYWKRFSDEDNSGIIFLSMPIENSSSILQTHFRHGKKSLFRFAFWSPDSEKPKFSLMSEDHVIAIKKRLENENDGYFYNTTDLYGILKTGNGIFVGSIAFSESKFQSRMGLFNLTFFPGMLLFLLWVLSWQRNLQQKFVRIEFRLVLILLLTITIPAAGLLITGIFTAIDHEKVLVSQIEKDLKQKLWAIEEDFVSEDFQFGEICNRFMSLARNNSDFKALETEARKKMDERKIAWFEARSLNGDVILNLRNSNHFDGLENLHDDFFRFLIHDRLKDRLATEKTLVKNVPDEVFNNIFQSSDFGFAQISEAPERVHSFKFGGNEDSWFWGMVREPGRPVAMLSIHQATEISRLNFLTRIFNGLGREKFAVFNSAQRKWLYGSEHSSEKILRLVMAANVTGQPESGIVENNEGRFVALAFPGSILTPYTLVRLVDYGFVESSVSQMRQSIAAGLLVIFLIAFSIAVFLGRIILEPVKKLDEGIIRIQKYDFEVPIEIAARDEFGSLTQAFNEMQQNLKEMQMASIVQKALLPQKIPDIEGYETSFFNVTATDLGGDYCDILRAGKEEWVMVVGDVSGHGTPAAIAMAMAKAALFKAIEDGAPFEKYPEIISNMLLKNLKRKKMMTMLFVFLNRATDELRIINAGHNWPLIIGNDGSVKEIKVEGMPLGIRENKRGRQEVRIILEPGQTLFCYTDALVEGRRPDSTVFGHERLYEVMKTMAGLNSEAIVTRTYNLWQEFLAGGIREDDFTLLIIRKKDR